MLRIAFEDLIARHHQLQEENAQYHRNEEAYQRSLSDREERIQELQSRVEILDKATKDWAEIARTFTCSRCNMKEREEIRNRPLVPGQMFDVNEVRPEHIAILYSLFDGGNPAEHGEYFAPWNIEGMQFALTTTLNKLYQNDKLQLELLKRVHTYVVRKEVHKVLDEVPEPVEKVQELDPRYVTWEELAVFYQNGKYRSQWKRMIAHKLEVLNKK